MSSMIRLAIKVRFPCEVMAKDVIPAFRALLARKLVVEYGFTQTQVANVLGVSQASINYYLTSKRGYKSEAREILKEFEETIDEIAEEIAAGQATQRDIIKHFCAICSQLKTKHLPLLTK